MLNFYHIIFSFCIIGFLYLCVYIYENFAKDIFLKKSKYNNKKKNKSSIDTLNKINLIKKNFDIQTTEEISTKINKILILPSNINLNKVKQFDISNNIIKLFDDKPKTKQILCSFIYTKLIYNKIFVEKKEDRITDLNNFYKLYKKLTINDIDGYNIVLKLYNDNNKNNFQYIFMHRHKLIKISNYEEYENILNNLYNNYNFLLKKDNNYYTSIGNYNIFDITPIDIKSMFFNKEDLKNKVYKKNYKQLKKYNKIIIFYWISTRIPFN